MSLEDPKVLAAIGAIVAVVAGWYMYGKNKKSADNQGQSQTPAADAAANYSVPPNIGIQTDTSGGVSYQSGMGSSPGSTTTLTNGAAQALPMNG